MIQKELQREGSIKLKRNILWANIDNQSFRKAANAEAADAPIHHGKDVWVFPSYLEKASDRA